MQVLAGDVDLAQEAFAAFLSLWRRFGLLPERFLMDSTGGSLHPLEQCHPLRPELMESAFYLYQVGCTAPVRGHLSVEPQSCSLMHSYPRSRAWAGSRGLSNQHKHCPALYASVTSQDAGWTLRWQDITPVQGDHCPVRGCSCCG